MRSNISIANNGIINARQSASAIVRNAADRPSLFTTWCALAGYAWDLALTLRDSLQHPTAVTKTGKPSVTGGALQLAVAMQRSERHSSMCRSAAR